MSTFIQLCQQLRQEAGVSGTGPAAVTSQTGMNKKLVDWIARAWTEIQNSRPDWLWMVEEFTFPTIVGVGNYTAASVSISDLGEWDRNTFRIYLASSGINDEKELPWIPYKNWRVIYGTGQQSDDYPVCFTIKPDKSVQLAPEPNAVYTVSGDYRKTPQTLSANTDTPEMPSRFHDLIVHKALMYYGASEGAAEVFTVAQEHYRVLRNALILDQTHPEEATESLV